MGLSRFGDPIEAKIVREYLQEIDILQEFSHVATPQDNGHIDRVACLVRAFVGDFTELFIEITAKEIFT